MPFNITIDHATTANSSDRSSLSTDEEEDGVHVSPRSPRSAADSQEYSDPAEEHDGSSSWTNVLYPEEIQPSDSASRPRTSNQQRPPAPEVPRAEEARRPSYRRRITQERAHNVPHQRAYRAPPSEPAESVDSHEEWQGYARGPPHHFSRQYYTAGYPSPHPYPAYAPPSVLPTGLPPGQQAMVPYGFPSYPPAVGGPAPSYFTHGHYPAQGHEMVPHAPPPGAYYPYAPQSFPMPLSPPPALYQTFPAVYSPPLPPQPAPPAAAPAAAPAPATPAAPTAPSTPPQPSSDISKDNDEKFARIEKLFLDQKAEQEAKEAAAQQALKDAAAKAEADRQKAEEIAAASSAAAAAAKEEVEAEYKAAAAKAEADKAAADKAAAEAAAAAAAAAPPPPPKEKDKPLKFQDAIGRKFSFPFHLCSTWSGMEYLIKEAFLHVEEYGPHVDKGMYDLIGPHGEIVMKSVWETVVEPGWSISMHMWPLPEPPPPEEGGDEAGDIVVVDESGPPPPPDHEKDGKKKKKKQAGGLMLWTVGPSKKRGAKAKKK